MKWFRALAAGAASIFLPGLGHALVRDWLRAFMFAGLYISAIIVFLPTDLFAATESITEMGEAVSEETGMIEQFTLSFIVLFAAIDATFRALGFPPDSANNADGPTCPECGKELDEDLEFCHWCTTRLEPAETDEPEANEA